MIEFIEAFLNFLVEHSPELVSIVAMIATLKEAKQKMQGSVDCNMKIHSALKNEYEDFEKKIKDDLKDQSNLIHDLLIENKELKAQNQDLKILITKVRESYDGADEKDP